MSCPANPLDCATTIIGSTIGSAASSAWDQVCRSFANAASQLLQAFGKAFVAIASSARRSRCCATTFRRASP